MFAAMNQQLSASLIIIIIIISYSDVIIPPASDVISTHRLVMQPLPPDINIKSHKDLIIMPVQRRSRVYY